MAEPRAVTRQEQILAEAQKRLERIEKMREQMIQQVEKEAQHLEELREVQEDFTQSGGTEPPLSTTAPSSFQSQFDQFSTTKTNERLKPIGNEGIIDFAEKLAPPQDDIPYYSTSDQDQHYMTVNSAETFGKQLYVSGYYYSSGAHTKQYEYELRAGSGDMSVGDMVKAPVHPKGYHTGRNAKGGVTTHEHDRRFIITDIYEKKKFYPYHDRIDG